MTAGPSAQVGLVDGTGPTALPCPGGTSRTASARGRLGRPRRPEAAHVQENALAVVVGLVAGRAPARMRCCATFVVTTKASFAMHTGVGHFGRSV